MRCASGHYGVHDGNVSLRIRELSFAKSRRLELFEDMVWLARAIVFSLSEVFFFSFHQGMKLL